MTKAVDATVKVADQELTFKGVEAVDGNNGLSVGSLLKETGLVTYDVGFVNTAACKSAITYIDGDAGILRYRGYPIDQLAEKSTFTEVSYLLIYGELPTADELSAFEERIRRHTMLHEDLRTFFNGFPRDAHPMPVLSSAVSALGTFYQDSLDPFDAAQVEMSTVRLLAKVPTIAAMAHKKSVGQPYMYPDNSLSLVENFMRMTFGYPAESYQVDPTVAKALDLLFILHADHEQNCSTSTVRLVGSAQANLFNSVSAGIHALSGPLHGGANQAVLEMLGQLRESGHDPKKFMEKVKNKEEGIRLMGFGHRVYKNYDPRAAIVKKAADDILLHRAQALPQRRLLHRPHLQGHGLRVEDVHGAVRHRAPAGLDRPVARDDGRPRDEDRPPAPDLHGRTRAQLPGLTRPVVMLQCFGLERLVRGRTHR